MTKPRNIDKPSLGKESRKKTRNWGEGFKAWPLCGGAFCATSLNNVHGISICTLFENLINNLIRRTSLIECLYEVNSLVCIEIYRRLL